MKWLFCFCALLGAVCMTRAAGADLADSASSAPAAEREPIIYYDMSEMAGWDLHNPIQLRRYYDMTMLVTSLQGLVNRDGATLFVRYNAAPDDFWWARMTEQGAWLAGRPVKRIENLHDLLMHFKDAYQGAVVWDERVPATSNLAATIAGADDLLVLRADDYAGSLFAQLAVSAQILPVKVDLRAKDGSVMFTGAGTIPGTALPSTGSPKNDVYRWMIEKYIKTGKTSATTLGYYLDGFWLKCWQASERQNHTVNNLDYVIAHRGPIFDLNVWTDEAPVDEPAQRDGLDRETLLELLRACWDRTDGKTMIHVAGFTPWAYKYTDHSDAHWSAGGKHGGVATEWMYAELLSCFNAYMDADALAFSSFPNGSVYQHFPLPAVLPQKSSHPTRENLIERGILDEQGRIVPRNYYAHYQGDYDAAAWLYWKMPEFWTDPQRGAVPMTWAFNPNLAQRFAFGMAWMRQTATPNDRFVAGDSGAGYINPYHLSEPRQFSGLPSGWAAWQAHCEKFFKQWDIRVCGFVIDGNTPGLTPEGWDVYAAMCPGGFIPQRCPKPLGVHNAAPFLRMYGDLPRDTANDALEGARLIHSNFVQDRPNFIFWRSILKSPSYYVQMDQEIKKLGGAASELVDLETLLWLVRELDANRELYVTDSPYAKVREVQTTPGQNEGAQAVRVGDGAFDVTAVQDKPCWVVPGGQQWAFLYFGLDDDFCRDLSQGPVTIELTFLDQGHGEIELQYDSIDVKAPVGGAYKPCAPRVQRTGDGQWRTVTFEVPDANFQKSQNGMSDFRFHNMGDPLSVARLVVRKAAQGGDVQ